MERKKSYNSLLRRGSPYLCVFMCLLFGTDAYGGTFNYNAFEKILNEYVKDGRVDYERLKKSNVMDMYISQLAEAHLGSLKTRAQKLTFWINAYNALAIKGVLDNYPLKSVMDVEGFFDKLKYEIAGVEYTLNDIENRVIRPTFGDPRIHFALVCASLSCPNLESKAFKPEDLDKELDEAGRKFLQDSAKNKIDKNKGIVYLSKIFEWYAQDFIKSSGSVLEFVRDYFSDEDRKYLRGRDFKVEFWEYDWNLNDKVN